MHNYDIVNDNNETLEDLMIDNKFPIPNEWKDENKMNIFD